MTKAMRWALMALVAAGTVAGAAEAQDRRVRIHNETGLVLYKFYSTNTGSKKWGRDVMGSSTLDSGASMVLNFDNNEGYCLFDFRAIFEDGTDAQRQGVNVCELSDYTYNP